MKRSCCTNIIYYKQWLDWSWHLRIPFTWYKKREANAIIFARLDCAAADVYWLKLYHTTSIHNLSIKRSNHAIHSFESHPNMCLTRHSPFKFDVNLFLNDNFFNLVQQIWLFFIRGYHAYDLTRKSSYSNR